MASTPGFGAGWFHPESGLLSGCHEVTKLPPSLAGIFIPLPIICLSTAIRREPFAEASMMRIGGIYRHENLVKIWVPQTFHQQVRIRMPRDAKIADHLLLPRLEQRLQLESLKKYCSTSAFVSMWCNCHASSMVRVEQLQRFLEQCQRAVAMVVRVSCWPDKPGAAPLHHLPHVALTPAFFTSIHCRRIHVVDPEVERPFDNRQPPRLRLFGCSIDACPPRLRIPVRGRVLRGRRVRHPICRRRIKRNTEGSRLR